ncbi:MAG TPA: DUF3341 domain-containing protein [Polyangiaceae bacterium]|nr:DUF3341 domain-containing protein [Polyangiaceae bacterium]
MKKSVLGIVETRAQAESIVANLQNSGVGIGDISVLFPDKSGTRDFAHEHNTKAPEGAVAGVGTGGLIGGALGLLAGVGALAIPGLGPFIAAGPLMAALSGAAAGAAVGGIAGALIGLGIPEIEAKRYEGKIRGGNILVAVHTENSTEQKRAEEVLKQAGAHDITSTSENSPPKERDSSPRAVDSTR